MSRLNSHGSEDRRCKGLLLCLDSSGSIVTVPTTMKSTESIFIMKRNTCVCVEVLAMSEGEVHLLKRERGKAKTNEDELDHERQVLVLFTNAEVERTKSIRFRHVKERHAEPFEAANLNESVATLVLDAPA